MLCRENVIPAEGKKEVNLCRQRISYPSVTGGVFLPFLGLTAPLFCRFAFGAAGSEDVEVPVFEVPVSARLRDPTCLPEVAGRALGAEPPGLVDAGARGAKAMGRASITSSISRSSSSDQSRIEARARGLPGVGAPALGIGS